MNNSILTIVFINFLTMSLQGQLALDAPFIYEKEHYYLPKPLSIFNSWSYTPLKTGSPPKENFYSNMYPNSHFYCEPEYVRVRCFKYIPFNGQEFIFNQKPQELYKFNSIKKIYLSPTKSIQKKDVLISYPKYLSECANKTIYPYNEEKGSSIQKEYSTRLLTYPELKSNGSFIDSSNKLILNKKYYPEQFESIDFKELIYSSLINGTITGFPTMEYNRVLTKNELLKLLNKGDFKIKGVRLKEDYYINPLTLQPTSLIVGLGLITNKTDIGYETIWFYFPELIHEFRNKGSFKNGQFYSYSNLFEQHHLHEEIESFYTLGSYKDETSGLIDNNMALNILPHFYIELEKEAIQRTGHKPKEFTIVGTKVENTYSGSINIFDSKRNLILRGSIRNHKANGAFHFYYQNGKLKAKLNFSKNHLNGQQNYYYPNGNLYAKCDYKMNQISSLERKYEDGTVLEKGRFKNGLMNGNWVYHIRTNNYSINKILLDNPKAEKHLLKGYFNYSVKYSQSFGENCPRKKCLQSKLTDNK